MLPDENLRASQLPIDRETDGAAARSRLTRKSSKYVSVLGFNLGIETTQLIVVALTMPSLVLLSRTGCYSLLRIGAALFAAFASVGWLTERLLGVHNSLNVVVNGVAHHAAWIAAALFLIAVVRRLIPQNSLRFSGIVLREQRNEQQL